MIGFLYVPSPLSATQTLDTNGGEICWLIPAVNDANSKHNAAIGWRAIGKDLWLRLRSFLLNFHSLRALRLEQVNAHRLASSFWVMLADRAIDVMVLFGGIL